MVVLFVANVGLAQGTTDLKSLKGDKSDILQITNKRVGDCIIRDMVLAKSKSND